jgi:hypothetical protein
MKAQAQTSVKVYSMSGERCIALTLAAMVPRNSGKPSDGDGLRRVRAFQQKLWPSFARSDGTPVMSWTAAGIPMAIGTRRFRADHGYLSL